MECCRKKHILKLHLKVFCFENVQFLSFCLCAELHLLFAGGLVHNTYLSSTLYLLIPLPLLQYGNQISMETKCRRDFRNSNEL